MRPCSARSTTTRRSRMNRLALSIIAGGLCAAPVAAQNDQDRMQFYMWGASQSTDDSGPQFAPEVDAYAYVPNVSVTVSADTTAERARDRVQVLARAGH